MKKLISLLLVIMLIGLTACSADKPKAPKTMPAPNVTITPTEEITPTVEVAEITPTEEPAPSIIAVHDDFQGLTVEEQSVLLTKWFDGLIENVSGTNIKNDSHLSMDINASLDGVLLKVAVGSDSFGKKDEHILHAVTRNTSDTKIITENTLIPYQNTSVDIESYYDLDNEISYIKNSEVGEDWYKTLNSVPESVNEIGKSTTDFDFIMTGLDSNSIIKVDETGKLICSIDKPIVEILETGSKSSLFDFVRNATGNGLDPADLANITVHTIIEADYKNYFPVTIRVWTDIAGDNNVVVTEPTQGVSEEQDNFSLSINSLSIILTADKLTDELTIPEEIIKAAILDEGIEDIDVNPEDVSPTPDEFEGEEWTDPFVNSTTFKAGEDAEFTIAGQIYKYIVPAKKSFTSYYSSDNSYVYTVSDDLDTYVDISDSEIPIENPELISEHFDIEEFEQSGHDIINGVYTYWYYKDQDNYKKTVLLQDIGAPNFVLIICCDFKDNLEYTEVLDTYAFKAKEKESDSKDTKNKDNKEKESSKTDKESDDTKKESGSSDKSNKKSNKKESGKS